jgi:gallate decarboxylase subunit D
LTNVWVDRNSHKVRHIKNKDMEKYKYPGRNFTVKTGEDVCDVQARVQWIGEDLLVAVYGGEIPHIGAVSAAHPRPSLKYPDVTSSTASVLCFSGHREDELAKKCSQLLAARLNTRVVVTAGMHWDNITDQGIKKIVENTGILTDLILKKIIVSS